MKRTDRWAFTFAVAASMTMFGQSPGTSSNSSLAAQEGGQKVTVQGCLLSATGMSRSSTGIATLGSPGDGSSAGSTASSTAGPATLAEPVFILRVSGDASGAAQTGMPSATAGQTDARAAAGDQGGTVYRLVADGRTTLGAYVGQHVEVSGKVSAPATGDAAIPPALAASSVLTVDRLTATASLCK